LSFRRANAASLQLQTELFGQGLKRGQLTAVCRSRSRGSRGNEGIESRRWQQQNLRR
jgi:hypothetical protein